ncbi:MAG: NAD-dependent epimerase/dehydratase family protein [Actinomycetota bacterium]
MTTVFLTGVTGYIAKHCCLTLLNQGYDVRASLRSLDRADEVRAAVTPHLTNPHDLDKRLTFVALDLTQDAGWSEALAGVDVLMHTASPFPIESPSSDDELIRPAVDGTLRALRAAHAAGVARVILTSSVAAIDGHGAPDVVVDESMWTDVESSATAAYSKSKTLAERAAWDFVKNEAPEMALTTINPVLVLGAPLDKNFGASVSIIELLLNRAYPMLPQLELGVVDVRDVATMHVAAITTEATKGERLIACAGAASFLELSKGLAEDFPSRSIITRQAPNALVWFLGIFDARLRSIRGGLGKPTRISSAKAQSLLGITFITPRVSTRETAAFLIDNGLLKK